MKPSCKVRIDSASSEPLEEVSLIELNGAAKANQQEEQHIQEIHHTAIKTSQHSFDTIHTLCDHIQSLTYNYLSHVYDSSHTLKYVEIDHCISQLKYTLSKLTRKEKRQAFSDVSQLYLSPVNSKPKLSTKSDSKQAIIEEEPGLWVTQTSRGVFSQSSGSLRQDPLYSIDSLKYCGCSGSIRQDWNTIELDEEDTNWEELKPCWFELFFDLMFVASIVHISSEAVLAYEHGDGSFLFIVQIFAQFGLFALAWIEQVLYQSRFRMNQFIDGALRFIYMALVLTMGLGISDNEIAHKMFLVSYICTKFVFCIMLIKSALIPRAFNHSLFMIAEKIITIIVGVCVLIFINYTPSTYLIVFSLLFVYSYAHIIVAVYCDCIRHLGINLPINVPHTAERMGAFILIILGETIISIVIQHFEANTHSILVAYSVTMCFFIIVYCSGKLYFEAQPTENELHHKAQAHALTKSVFRARIYCFAHIVLFFGLLGLGIGAKLITHHLYDNGGPEAMEVIFLPSISCIVILISINVIRLTHPFDYCQNKKILWIIVWLLRVIYVGALFGLLFTWNVIPQYYILIFYVMCFVVQICIDFESRERKKESKIIQNNTHGISLHKRPSVSGAF